MNVLQSCLLSGGLLLSLSAHGQVTITATDMFNEVGLYFLAYSNPFDPTSLSSTPYPTANVMGSAGPNQFWDFSKGPTDVVYRFDYLAASNVVVAADFPQAKIVEQQTDQASGATQYLFFEQVPGVGRKVYGFYAENPLFDPSNIFSPPIVDFPEQITYGQEWTTSTTWQNEVSGLDPTDPETGGFSIAQQATQTSDLKVDAYGTIVVPDGLGSFGPGLRISEQVTIDVSFDDGSGSFQHVETDYARNYYWVMPGRGIVAALASTQSQSPPPDNFATATQFWRMFETNKKASSSVGCVNPDPVTDLRIRVSNGQALLSWSKVNCATHYRVEYLSQSSGGAWTPLGDPTANTFMLDGVSDQNQTRFYRVVSLR